MRNEGVQMKTKRQILFMIMGLAMTIFMTLALFVSEARAEETVRTEDLIYEHKYVNSGDTYTIKSSIIDSSEVTVTGGAKVIIDLPQESTKFENTTFHLVGETSILEFKSSPLQLKAKAITVYGKGKCLVEDENANLNIYDITMDEDVNFIISKGNINFDDHNATNCDMKGNSKITVSGGNIKLLRLHLDENARAEISGGTFNKTTRIQGDGKINISGGDFDSDKYLSVSENVEVLLTGSPTIKKISGSGNAKLTLKNAEIGSSEKPIEDITADQNSNVCINIAGGKLYIKGSSGVPVGKIRGRNAR